MDLTNTIIPKSDQINADDLITGPRTFTIKGVRQGTSEQPVNIDLVELPGRPFRPSKTVLRILVTAWGKESDVYAGRRLTLYRDPDVKWAGQDVGGIRVSHLSDIAKPLTLALAETKSKKSKHTVQPLKDEPKRSATILPVDPPKVKLTAQQFSDIGNGLVALGITEPDTQMATVGQVIGRDVSDPKDLSRDEAANVLAWITDQQKPAQTAPADEWPATAEIPGTEQ